MEEPKWLTQDEIEFVHRVALEMAGGPEGIRDLGLLESALMRPKNLYVYGERDIFQLAASYAEAIAQNHPFVDGNKRVAFEAAVLFLHDNGFDLLPDESGRHASIMEKVAQSALTRKEVSEYFKKHSRSQKAQKPQSS